MLNLKTLSDESLDGYIQDLQRGIAPMREDLEYAVLQVNRALEERDRRRDEADREEGPIRFYAN